MVRWRGLTLPVGEKILRVSGGEPEAQLCVIGAFGVDEFGDVGAEAVEQRHEGGQFGARDDIVQLDLAHDRPPSIRAIA